MPRFALGLHSCLHGAPRQNKLCPAFCMPLNGKPEGHGKEKTVLNMKKLLVLVLVVAGFCCSIPFAHGETESNRVEALVNDVKIGDYQAYTADVNRTKSISFSVYAHPNARNNYYALIGGERYAVRENPDYNPKYVGHRTRNTHFIRYNNDNYYFSL